MILKVDNIEEKEWIEESQSSNYSLTYDSGEDGNSRIVRFMKNNSRMRFFFRKNKGIIKLRKGYSSYRKPSSILNILHS